MSTAQPPLRVPISVAARRGVSWLSEQAQDRRVLLTRFGQPTAAIDSAERLDETARQVVLARREVVEAVADAVANRTPGGLALTDVCAKLGIDVETVRAAARR